MFGLGKFFRKKAQVVATTNRRIENLDLMQATVGIALLVGWSSGDLSDQEAAKIQKTLANTPALEGFTQEVNEVYERYNAVFKDVGFLAGKVRILREIADVKSERQDAEDVFVTGLTIALADGSVDEKEREILEEVGNILGLRYSSYVQEA